MPTNIQILATATGITPQSNENREGYLKRLVTATAALSEDAWNKLPVDAQTAHNLMAEAMNNNAPLSEATPDAAEPPAPTKPDKPARAPRPPRAESVQSPTGRARELMVLNANITPAEVLEVLKTENLVAPSMSSIQAMRSEIRSVLRILAAAGRLVVAETPADAPIAQDEPATA